MKITLLFCATLTVLAPNCVHAELSAAAKQTFGTPCERLAGRYDDLSKVVAFATESGMDDDSAVRETYRQLQIANAYAEGAQTLSVMASQKCPMPTKPINPLAYSEAASNCIIAGGAPTAPQCIQASWQRDPAR